MKKDKKTGSLVGRIAGRFLAIIRHEGLTGVLDRLRDPKPLWRHRWHFDPLSGPVLIQGGSVEQREKTAEALKSHGIALVATQSKQNYCEILYIDPSPARLATVDRNDILLLHDTACNDALVAAAAKCRALLVRSSETVNALRWNNVSLDKIFLFTDIAEGLNRLLFALQGSPHSDADWKSFAALQDLPEVPHICLSLPETIDRRNSFLSLHMVGFRIFDGIRHIPGWIGAGSSFRMMAQACLAQGIRQAIFCEDDLKIRPDYDARLEVVSDYLETGDWDVFSGLLTDVSADYVITAVVRQKGEVFVHLNHCVGMVYGIYNERALRQIAAWNAADGLTIDRHLEKAEGLKVVTTLPFLVDHCNDLRSSMWHFRNRRYRNLIRKSERRLTSMVESFEASPRTNSEGK